MPSTLHLAQMFRRKQNQKDKLSEKSMWMLEPWIKNIIILISNIFSPPFVVIPCKVALPVGLREVAMSIYVIIFFAEAFLFVTAVGRYTTGSFKFSCNDTICELKGQLEDSYESSQSMTLRLHNLTYLL